jgi:uncharacterized membrane protein
MWLLGLLIGAGCGAIFDHPFLGALAGLALGILAGRQTATVPSYGERRLQAMETRLQNLEQDYVALKARLHVLEGGEPPALPESEAEPAVVAEAVAVPEPAAFREAGPEPVSAPSPWLDPAPVASRENRPVLEFPPKWDQPAEPEADPLAELWRRLLSGNLLAKIGVALLFFGVASALKLAAEHGWFPPALRLLLGAAAGGAMVAFGWTKRDDQAHRTFALVLQGGGFGLLYLMGYFAQSWYGLIGHGFAFVLFALLGLGCTVLAVREDGPVLAVVGLAGAFLAPLLASTGEGSHIALFSYYLLLNGFILGVAWFRDWRALTATGFLFTFVVGLAWAWSRYRPEHYLSTQLFLVLFFVLYSATPVVFALLRAPGRHAFAEGMLLFGTPIAGLVLQAPLVDDHEYGLAWSAFLAGLYYFGLWRAVAHRTGPDFELLRTTHFGIGLGLVTLAVPLAFGAETTVAIWSVEGAATLWLSLRLARPLGQWFGVLVQFGAGLWLLAHGPELAAGRAFTNGLFVGGMLVALAGLASAAMLRAGRPGKPGAAALLAWGLLWWYGTGLHEIAGFALPARKPGLGLLLFAATGLAGEYAGRGFRWFGPRAAGMLVLPAAVAAVLLRLDGGGEFLRGWMAVALPAGLAVHYWALRRREADGAEPPGWSPLAHPGAAWLVTFVLAHDAFDLAERWWPSASLWQTLALGLVPAALLCLATAGVLRGWRPFADRGELYAAGFVLPLALLLSAWFAWANFEEPGGAFPAYVPLLDPFDLGLGAVLLAIIQTGRLGRNIPVWTGRLLLPLALVGCGGLAARLAHHWWGVPFRPGALMGSGVFQAILSILWTVLAIALMIHAARALRRERWFAGFGLLALVGAKLLFVDLGHSGTGTWTASLIGIALLVLAAGYFAPVPPRE